MDQAPCVFISYSHDSDEHRERVLRLAERLRADGIDPILDRYVNGSPAQGWPRWMLDGLDRASRVLLICTPTYYRRFRGHEEPGKGKGVDWEGAIVTQAIYDTRSATTRFIPILFHPADEAHIPEPVRGQTYYCLTSEAAYQPLYDALLEQAGVEPGRLGRLKRKKRPGAKPLAFDKPAVTSREARGRLHEALAGIQAPRAADTGPNPFDQTLAIRDPERFVGRAFELRRLEALLAGGSVSLQGAPKIGKSSLLWRLAGDWPGEVLGPIDLQGVEDRDDFYGCLAALLGLAEPRWRAVRAALRSRQVLLLIDELDACLQAFGAEDLGRLRALCGENRGLRLVAASRVPPKDLFPVVQGSPPYNFLQPLSLGPMPEAEARMLLAHPWMPGARGLDARDVSAILRLAQGHPFKLQRAGFHCYELGRDGSSASDWQRLWQIDLGQML